MVLAEAPAILDVQTGLSKAEVRHLGALERRIAQGLQTFREVGAALLEIRDAKLYRESHETFEAYCAEKWAMPRATAYGYINSAKVVKMLGDPEELTNEAQARELVAVLDEPKLVKQVWKAVEATNEPVTAALIRRVRETVVPTPGNGFHRLDNPTERLMASIVRLGAEHARWKATKPTIGERNKVKAAIKAFIEAIGG